MIRAQELLARYIWDNPVFLKEMRLHSRSQRAYMTQFFYIFLLGFILSALLNTSYVLTSNGGSISGLWVQGQWFFYTVLSLHVVFLSILMTSMASSSVTSEKEARTFELLRSLPMTTGMYVTGTFFSLMTLTGILVLSSLPLFMLALAYVGGVSSQDMACSFIYMAGLCAACAAFGILSSCIADTSRQALFMCGRLLVGMYLLTGFGSLFTRVAAYRFTRGYSPAAPYGAAAASSLWLSPLWTLMKVLTCGVLSCVLLTAAADRLRPEDEKRPYLLLTQIFAIYVACAATFVFLQLFASRPLVARAIALLWAVGPSALLLPPGAASGPFPFSTFLSLQAVALMCLSAVVLPSETAPRPGWRGFFAPGPVRGAVYLASCFAAGNAFLAAYWPWVDAGPHGAAFWLAGQGVVLGALVFWSGLAAVCRVLAPRRARQAYTLGLVFVCVGPPLVQSIFFRHGASTPLTCALAMNPVLGMSAMDPGGGADFLKSIGFPQMDTLAAAALWLNPCLGLALAWAASRLRLDRLARGPLVSA